MLYLKSLKINQTSYRFYKKKYFFDWTLAYQSVFDSLKKMVIKAPILAHYE